MILFDCVFSYIAGNFGGCFGVAIGMSLTAVVEVLYWIVLKPFGFEKKECERCKEKGKHHYNSCISKKIVTWVQIISIGIFIFFACYKFYLLV